MITTLDELIAGMRPPEDFLKVSGTLEAAGVHSSLFYAAGRPGAAVAPTPGLVGAALIAYAGQIPTFNPPAGRQYLARLDAAASLAGTLRLLDRLWHNSGIVPNTTGVQLVNSVAWPARDRDGNPDGRNVLVALEVSTVTSNAAPVTNTTLSYTNQAGIAGRTATMASFPATAQVGTFVPFALQIGDTGVRSVQSITLGTSYGAAAVVHLVAYRPLARLGLPVPNVAAALDALTGGFVRLHDDTVPFLIWLPTTTGAVTVEGQMVTAWG